MNVYPSYFHSLREAPCKHVVQRIIQDESEHLAYLEERLSLWPAAKDFLHSPLWEHEHSCFDRYLQGMHKLFSISLTKSLPER